MSEPDDFARILVAAVPLGVIFGLVLVCICSAIADALTGTNDGEK